jgi:DNA mismatch endonuclease (patch repair protein)
MDDYPHPTSRAVTAVMKGNRSQDTRPEVELRAELHKLGLRFRKDYTIRLPDRRVRIDVAFTRQRVAVFVDGCFWHGCPKHGHYPRKNVHYWGPKLERNRKRDAAVTDGLERAGWRVLRFWEHVPPADAARQVLDALSQYPSVGLPLDQSRAAQ